MATTDKGKIKISRFQSCKEKNPTNIDLLVGFFVVETLYSKFENTNLNANIF